MRAYVCLLCGSDHGDALEAGSENWYWRIVEHGRLGPFCSDAHAATFRHPADSADTFTIAEVHRLLFLRDSVYANITP